MLHGPIMQLFWRWNSPYWRSLPKLMLHRLGLITEKFWGHQFSATHPCIFHNNLWIIVPSFEFHVLMSFEIHVWISNDSIICLTPDGWHQQAKPIFLSKSCRHVKCPTKHVVNSTSISMFKQNYDKHVQIMRGGSLMSIRSLVFLWSPIGTYPYSISR